MQNKLSNDILNKIRENLSNSPFSMDMLLQQLNLPKSRNGQIWLILNKLIVSGYLKKHKSGKNSIYSIVNDPKQG